jgi:hypothetical protein
MTVSAISGAPAVAAAPQAAPARAADGDQTQPSAQTAQVKDNDGDYRPAASSPAASSSSGVQAALTLLKTGG